MQSQSLVGKSLTDVSKEYDSYYVFKSNNSNLHGAVFVKGLEGDAKYLYVYSDSSGIIKIQLDERLSFAEPNYYGIIDPTIIDSPSDFKNGRAVVTKRDADNYLYGIGDFGMIDSTGKVVIEPKYYSLGKLSEGLIKYSEKHDRRVESGYLNAKGEKVIVMRDELSKLYMGCYFEGGDFKNGIAIMNLVENDSDCNCSCSIVIDKSGKILNQDGVLLDANYQVIKLDY